MIIPNTKLNIINADCMDIMKDYPDKYFDLAIVDPPFGIGKTWIKRKRDKNKFEGSYKNKLPPADDYFTELSRVSKNYIIWGANYFSFGWPTKNIIIWDKQCTWEKDHKGECELAITNLNHRPATVYTHQWAGARKAFETGIKIIHPHQKPIKLYEWLLNDYSLQEWKVLDTHLGSGSNAIANHYFGTAEFVGIEIDKHNFNTAVQRITNETLQLIFNF